VMVENAGLKEAVPADGVLPQASPRVHGIVLAGAYPGHCALDQLIPRPLLPVAQKPLITYSLRWMEGGLRAATICANSVARPIRHALKGHSTRMRLGFLEDWSPRGAAGCARDAGLRTDADTFVVADGTSVPVLDLKELVAGHIAMQATLTVVVGADAAGRLRPSGIYVFDRKALTFVPEDGFQDIKERLIPRLYGAGEHVATHMAPGLSPRVVSTDTYLALNQWALERAALHEGLDGFQSQGGAFVHESATVDPSARLLGPVLVGPKASVGAGATLVGPVSVGEGTRVGQRAVVSRSVVWNGCDVGDGAFVDRCMLADGVRVSPGRSVFAAMKVNDRRSRPPRGATQRPAEALWGPIVAALRPTTPHHL
jgi:NDP-sugar pyrophosphorylase family protein